MLSDYGANAILNAVFSKTSSFGALATAPSIYVGLLTAIPDPSKTGSTVTEIAYTGYARVNVVAGSWNAASGRLITNSGTISFGTMTGGAGGTVNAIGLFDASSAGNMIAYGVLMNPQTITAGNLTSSGNTATVVLTAHGFSVGNSVLITNTEQPEYAGFHVIKTVADANHFTYDIETATSPAATATVTSGNAMQVWGATTLSVSANIQPQFTAGNLAVPMS